MSNQISGLEDARKPLRVAGRDAYVFPRYLDRMQEHENEFALVTHRGIVIERGGISLRLGMVPMERRYAIGRVENGMAEVLPQTDFDAEHEKNYVEEYNMRGKAPDNVKLRYVPNVVDFVATKVDPTNPAKIVGIEFDPGRVSAPVKPDEALVEVETLRAEKDVQALKIDELQRKLDELAEMVMNKPAVKPAPNITVAEKETAPCGRQVTKGYVEQHIARCQKPECSGSEA